MTAGSGIDARAGVVRNALVFLLLTRSSRSLGLLLSGFGGQSLLEPLGLDQYVIRISKLVFPADAQAAKPRSVILGALMKVFRQFEDGPSAQFLKGEPAAFGELAGEVAAELAEGS